MGTVTESKTSSIATTSALAGVVTSALETGISSGETVVLCELHYETIRIMILLKHSNRMELLQYQSVVQYFENNINR